MMKIAVLSSLLLVAGCASQVHDVPVRSELGVRPDFQPLQALGNGEQTFRMQQLQDSYAIELTKRLEQALAGTPIRSGSVCKFAVHQLPSGLVLNVRFASCEMSAAEQDLLSKALVDRELPYYGFESVFRRDLQFTVCAPKSLCTK
jgi:hypothetical protein